MRNMLERPLRRHVLSLVQTCPEEGGAAYLSVVAPTQLAMEHGLKGFHPFHGPIAGCKASHAVESLA
jgi:hypothetical protein